MFEGLHGRPRIDDVVDTGERGLRLPGESAAGRLASSNPVDRLLRLLVRSAQGLQCLESPPGVHHVAVAAVGGRSVVEAAVGPAAGFEILDERRGDIVHRQADQPAAQEAHHFHLEDGVACASRRRPGTRRALSTCRSARGTSRHPVRARAGFESAGTRRPSGRVRAS